jgi:hypothetical protein
MRYIFLGLNEKSLNTDLGTTDHILKRLAEYHKKEGIEYTLIVQNKCVSNQAFEYSLSMDNTVHIDALPELLNPYREKFMSEENRKKLKENFKPSETPLKDLDIKEITIVPKNKQNEFPESGTIDFCVGKQSAIYLQSSDKETRDHSIEGEHYFFKKVFEISPEDKTKILVPTSFNHFALFEKDKETKKYSLQFVENQIETTDYYSISRDETNKLNELYDKAFDLKEIENYMSKIKEYEDLQKSIQSIEEKHKIIVRTKNINKERIKTNKKQYEITKEMEKISKAYEKLQTTLGKLHLYKQFLEEYSEEAKPEVKEETKPEINNNKQVIEKIEKRMTKIKQLEKGSEISYHEKTWLNPFTQQKEYVERSLNFKEQFGSSTIPLETDLSMFSTGQ